MRHKIFHLLNFLAVLLILTSYKSDRRQNKLISIPTQTLNLYKIIGVNWLSAIQTIDSFEISSFVTYEEYKEYLSSIKKDSSEQFYLSQFPDTTIAPKEVYQKYISSTDYDDYPVLGISWDNAMNYCKWKTLRDNPKDSINFIYRLPKCSEWLAAHSYLEENHKPNDFNKNYSDWLLSSKFENYLYDAKNYKFVYDNVYLHKKDDPLTMKRKFAIGDSYVCQQEHLEGYYGFNYYSTQGYRHISFRYVKTEKKNSKDILEFWGINIK